MSPNKLYPALLGGLFIGVFSALPIISVGNLCCCIWLIAGGVLAAWLMQQNHPTPVTPADGALVGLLAGIVGAFAYLVIAWPVAVLFGPMMDRWMQTVIENAGDMPIRDVLNRYRGMGARAISVVLSFVLQLVLGMIFPTLGGLLGAVLFRRAGPPPPPPTLPPGAWTPPPPTAPPDAWTPPPPPAIPEARPTPAPPDTEPPAAGPLVSGPIQPRGPVGPAEERPGGEGGGSAQAE